MKLAVPSRGKWGITNQLNISLFASLKPCAYDDDHMIISVFEAAQYLFTAASRENKVNMLSVYRLQHGS